MYATRALVDVLVDLASEADPEPVSTGVSVLPAESLHGAGVEGLSPETPVFSDFIMPDPRNPVNAVFGVELSTPAGQAQGRFVSHPIGELDVTKRDDLAQVVFVAVPPWDASADSFGAFDRNGRRQSLDILDARPPAETL